jgi:hypothetical protein
MYGLAVRIPPPITGARAYVQAPCGVRYNQAMIFSGCHG